MAIKVGISGFGRIARVVIRAAMDDKDIDICGINVRNADKEYMVYMLKYDSIFGRFPKSTARKCRSTVRATLPISRGANAARNIL